MRPDCELRCAAIHQQACATPLYQLQPPPLPNANSHICVLRAYSSNKTATPPPAPCDLANAHLHKLEQLLETIKLRSPRNRVRLEKEEKKKQGRRAIKEELMEFFAGEKRSDCFGRGLRPDMCIPGGVLL